MEIAMNASVSASDTRASSKAPESPEPPHKPSDEDVGEGLTDDERVSREDDKECEGARVTPGPADRELLEK
jgi:hypothetical protein